MEIGYSLITAIALHFDVGMDTRPDRILIKFEIMDMPRVLSRTDDSFPFAVYYYLCFYRMALFFARIPLLLFFLGRWTGLSVTSTTAHSIALPLSNNAFFPGK